MAGRIPKATRSVKTSQKIATAAEANTFCIKPLTHYLPRSDLKIGEYLTTMRNKMQQNFTLLKKFGNVKKSKIIKMVKTLIG